MSARHRPSASILVPVAVGVLLVILAAIRFRPVLGSFFTWDDFRHLGWGQDLVQNCSWATIWKYFSVSQGSMYRALPSLMAGVDYKLWGVQPLGWHLTTAGFHVGACWLVFIIGRRIFRSDLAGLIAAVCTLLFPLSVDCVAWITLREETMCLFFYLLALVLFLVHAGGPGGARGRVAYAGSLLAATSAYFCKEIAVSLPIALLVADATLGGLRPRRAARRLLALLPFALAAALFLWARSVVHGGLVVGLTAPDNTPYGDVFNYAGTLPQTLRHLVGRFPRIMLLPAHPDSGTYVELRRVIIPLLIVACATLPWRKSDNLRALGATALLVLVAALPVIPFLAQLEVEIGESRRYYLPSAFLCLFLAGLFLPRLRTTRRALRQGATILGAALGVALATRYWTAAADGIAEHAGQAHGFEMLLDGFASDPQRPPAGSTLYFTPSSSSSPPESIYSYTKLTSGELYCTVTLDERGTASPMGSCDWATTPPLPRGDQDFLFQPDLLSWGDSDHLYAWDHQRMRLFNLTTPMADAVARRPPPGARPPRRWQGSGLDAWSIEGAARRVRDTAADSTFAIESTGSARLEIAMPALAAAHFRVLEIRVACERELALRVSWGPFPEWASAESFMLAELPAAEQRVRLPIGEHPDWILQGRIEQLTLELRPSESARALLRGIELR